MQEVVGTNTENLSLLETDPFNHLGARCWAPVATYP